MKNLVFELAVKGRGLKPRRKCHKTNSVLQFAEKLRFWVAQRFNAAIRLALLYRL
jgi:hypothetical protein